MMKKVLASGIILSAILVGCNKDESTAPAAPKTDASTTADKAMTEAKDAANSAGQASKDAAKATGDAASNAAQSTKDAAANATSSAQTNANSATANQPAVSADTQSKLDEIVQDIKDKKYDLADKALTELENNKANLPAAVQTQLPALRSSLNAAKASGGIKLPGQ